MCNITQKFDKVNIFPVHKGKHETQQTKKNIRGAIKIQVTKINPNSTKGNTTKSENKALKAL